MKIACIITAYKDPEQLRRTVNKLRPMECYIHIDSKVDINPFIKSLNDECVNFVKDRVFVGWGGYSQVESIKRCMRDVINSGIKYDRVLCITGQDYPVYCYEIIEHYFEKQQNKNFLVSLDITHNTSSHALEKVQRYWFYDIKIKNPFAMKCVRKILYFACGALYNFRIAKKNCFLEVSGKKWNVYFGSDYWCLTYDCFLYVYEMINNKEVENYFRFSFAPSEMVIHTIISNSIYYDTVEHVKQEDYVNLQTVTPLQYIDYTSKGMKILTEDDYTAVINSDKLFCRKVATGISDAFEDMLDKNGGSTD